jgi:hypothetical protein
MLIPTVNSSDPFILDDLGRVQFVTSYPYANGSGTPVNQVEDAYDGWGNLTQEWQSVSGPVNTSSTPSVQYIYADGSSGSAVAQYLRLTDVIYPDGSDISYTYGNGRPGSLHDCQPGDEQRVLPVERSPRYG